MTNSLSTDLSLSRIMVDMAFDSKNLKEYYFLLQKTIVQKFHFLTAMTADRKNVNKAEHLTTSSRNLSTFLLNLLPNLSIFFNGLFWPSTIFSDKNRLITNQRHDKIYRLIYLIVQNGFQIKILILEYGDIASRNFPNNDLNFH